MGGERGKKQTRSDELSSAMARGKIGEIFFRGMPQSYEHRRRFLPVRIFSNQIRSILRESNEDSILLDREQEMPASIIIGVIGMRAMSRSLARIGKYKFPPPEERGGASIKMQMGVRHPSEGSFFRLAVANYRCGSRRTEMRARVARDRERSR